MVGDTIIELSPDGEERVAFTVWDAFSIEDSDSLDTAYYGGMVDWTHANSIFYSAERNTYLVSLGKLDTVVEVDRDTAEVIDIINGDTYTFLSGTTPFNYQHDAKWTDSGTLLMTTTMDSQRAKNAMTRMPWCIPAGRRSAMGSITIVTIRTGRQFRRMRATMTWTGSRNARETVTTPTPLAVREQLKHATASTMTVTD